MVLSGTYRFNSSTRNTRSWEYQKYHLSTVVKEDSTITMASEGSRLIPVNGVVQPPVVPPPTKPRRNTNQLEFISKVVLKAIMKHKYAWPFNRPVDAIKLSIPDYHKIIKKPMDLMTIKKRLENHYYYSAEECQKDIMLVFDNCHLYNKPGEDVVVMAEVIEMLYREKVEDMPRKEVQLALPHSLNDRRGRRGKGSGLPKGGVKVSVPVALPSRDVPVTPPVPNLVKGVKQKADTTTPPSANLELSSEGELDSSFKSEKSITTPSKDLLYAPYGTKVKGVKQKADSTTPDDAVVERFSEETPKSLSRRERPIKKPSKDLPYYAQSKETVKTKSKFKMTKQIRFCYDLVKELLSEKHQEYASPFYNPVNPESFPDYHNIIKKPMDLGTVLKKTESGQYKDPDQFAQDVRLIFTNCYRYNPVGHKLVEMARKTQDVFELKYAKIPDSLAQEEPPPPVKGKAPCTASFESAESSSSDSGEEMERNVMLMQLHQEVARINDEINLLKKERTARAKKRKLKKKKPKQSLSSSFPPEKADVVDDLSSPIVQDPPSLLRTQSFSSTLTKVTPRPKTPKPRKMSSFQAVAPTKATSVTEQGIPNKQQKNYNNHNELPPQVTALTDSEDDYMKTSKPRKMNSFQAVALAKAASVTEQGIPNKQQKNYNNHNKLPPQVTAPIDSEDEDYMKTSKPRKMNSFQAVAPAKAASITDKGIPNKQQKNYNNHSQLPQQVAALIDSEDEDYMKPMSYDERRELSLAINKLPGDMLNHVVDILVANEPSFRDGDKEHMEIDFELLNLSTLHQLKKYVTSVQQKPKRPYTKRKVPGNSQNQDPQEMILELEKQLQETDMKLSGKIMKPDAKGAGSICVADAGSICVADAGRTASRLSTSSNSSGRSSSGSSSSSSSGSSSSSSSGSSSGSSSSSSSGSSDNSDSEADTKDQHVEAGGSRGNQHAEAGGSRGNQRAEAGGSRGNQHAEAGGRLSESSSDPGDNGYSGRSDSENDMPSKKPRTEESLPAVKNCVTPSSIALSGVNHPVANAEVYGFQTSATVNTPQGKTEKPSEPKIKNFASWSSLAQASVSSPSTSKATNGFKSSTTSDSFQQFRNQVKEKADKQRMLMEQQNMRRQMKELSDSEKRREDGSMGLNGVVKEQVDLQQYKNICPQVESLPLQLPVPSVNSTASVPPVSMSEVEKLRRLEQERRRIEAISSVVDLNQQRDMMADFERQMS